MEEDKADWMQRRREKGQRKASVEQTKDPDLGLVRWVLLGKQANCRKDACVHWQSRTSGEKVLEWPQLQV
jgi:hypothetical protein